MGGVRGVLLAPRALHPCFKTFFLNGQRKDSYVQPPCFCAEGKRSHRLVNSADSEGHLGEARKSTVGHLLEVMASHLLEHCAEISEIRQLHGRSLA